MVHLKIFTIITAVFAINSVAVAQNLGYYDMKPGEIYYVSYALSGSEIIKFRGICRIIDTYDAIDGARISVDHGDFHSEVDRYRKYYDGCTHNIHGLQNERRVRPATQEEKDWLNACIEVGKFISKEEALKLSSKNRGEIKTAQLSLNPADRNSPKFKGNRNGFCFSPVYFNYQFVNCGGEVQMGVNIYTNPQANYQKHTASNGYMFEGEHYVAVVSSTNEVDIQEVEADLYYGNQFLGKINLNYIVGNFSGCYGETFQVLKDVGKDPTAKEYRENLDKFELKNIRILRGDLKISDKEREQIHKSLKYDQFGNPRKPGSKPTQNTPKKYDAFGNEIKSNNSSNTQKKYDAFGNPIKN